MARTKINYRCPKTGKRRIGVLNTRTNRVLVGIGKSYSLDYLKQCDPNGIGFFETRIEGKLVQEIGVYEG